MCVCVCCVCVCVWCVRERERESARAAWRWCVWVLFVVCKWMGGLHYRSTCVILCVLCGCSNLHVLAEFREVVG